MPTKKIGEIPRETICTSREHNPPSHRVYEDGVYEHACPRCGKKQGFRVINPKW
jgi:hypothetical protein